MGTYSKTFGLITKGDLRTNIFSLKEKLTYKFSFWIFVAKKNFLQWLVWILLVMCLWQHNTIFIIFLQVAELTRSLRVRRRSVQTFKTQIFHIAHWQWIWEIYNITSNLPFMYIESYLWQLWEQSTQNIYLSLFEDFVDCAQGFNVIMCSDIF